MRESHPIVTLPRGPALTHRDTVRRRRLQRGQSRAGPQQDDAIRRPDQACNTALRVIARARAPLGRPPPCDPFPPGAHPRPRPRAWRARCAEGTAPPRARPNSPPWRQGHDRGIARARRGPAPRGGEPSDRSPRRRVAAPPPRGAATPGPGARAPPRALLERTRTVTVRRDFYFLVPAGPPAALRLFTQTRSSDLTVCLC